MTSGHSIGHTGTIKRKDRRRRINSVQPPLIPPKPVQNSVRSSARPQEMNVSSTGFPHFRFAIVILAILLGIPLHAQDPPPLVFRIFLMDGTQLVSYGEFAR